MFATFFSLIKVELIELFVFIIAWIEGVVWPLLRPQLVDSKRGRRKWRPASNPLYLNNDIRRKEQNGEVDGSLKAPNYLSFPHWDFFFLSRTGVCAISLIRLISS